MKSQNTKQKNSWRYGTLAHMIQFPPRHLAAKLVLNFLGEHANDGGASWHGYKSIMAHTAIRQPNSVIAAIRFIIAYSTEQIGKPLFTYTQGGPEAANRYRLNLAAMEALVRQQNIFDPASCKRISHNGPPTVVNAVPPTALSAVPSEAGTALSTPRGTALGAVKPPSNLAKSKATTKNKNGDFVFSGSGMAGSEPTTASKSSKNKNDFDSGDYRIPPLSQSAASAPSAMPLTPEELILQAARAASADASSRAPRFQKAGLRFCRKCNDGVLIKNNGIDDTGRIFVDETVNIQGHHWEPSKAPLPNPDLSLLDTRCVICGNDTEIPEVWALECLDEVYILEKAEAKKKAK